MLFLSCFNRFRKVAAALAPKITNARLALIQEPDQEPISTLSCFSPSARDRKAIARRVPYLEGTLFKGTIHQPFNALFSACTTSSCGR